MTGTCPLLDPDGSRRAAMVASLEYGTHALVGQHTYRARDMPFCMRCSRSGVITYGSLCEACLMAEEADQ